MPHQWHVGEEDTYLPTPRSNTGSPNGMVGKRTPTSRPPGATHAPPAAWWRRGHLHPDPPELHRLPWRHNGEKTPTPRSDTCKEDSLTGG